MKANEYISDRKMRFIFGVSQIQLLQAKAGDAEFDLEDIRYCYNCDRWFDASFHIATVEYNGQVEFTCARCADYFQELTPSNKEHFLRCSEYNFKYWQDQYRMKETA